MASKSNTVSNGKGWHRVNVPLQTNTLGAGRGQISEVCFFMQALALGESVQEIRVWACVGGNLPFSRPLLASWAWGVESRAIFIQPQVAGNVGQRSEDRFSLFDTRTRVLSDQRHCAGPGMSA